MPSAWLLYDQASAPSRAATIFPLSVSSYIWCCSRRSAWSFIFAARDDVVGSSLDVAVQTDGKERSSVPQRLAWQRGFAAKVSSRILASWLAGIGHDPY
jgi:hypothetical protein